MANFSVSFNFPFFLECFQMRINNTGKIQYSTNSELINIEKSCPYPLIFTLWYT